MILVTNNQECQSSGIYKIKNTVSGKIYIGSTVNLKRRFDQHLNRLLKNIHDNVYLQRSFNKYGKESFTFEILELVEESNLLIREQYFLDLEKSYERNLGYNISKLAGKIHMCEETRLKIGIAHTGMKRSEETCKNISEAKKRARHKHSDESKEKMSQAFKRNYEKRSSLLEEARKINLKNPRSKEHIEKVRQSGLRESLQTRIATDKELLSLMKDYAESKISTNQISEKLGVYYTSIQNLFSGAKNKGKIPAYIFPLLHSIGFITNGGKSIKDLKTLYDTGKLNFNVVLNDTGNIIDDSIELYEFLKSKEYYKEDD